jgi:hypothetical protein
MGFAPVSSIKLKGYIMLNKAIHGLSINHLPVAKKQKKEYPFIAKLLLTANGVARQMNEIYDKFILARQQNV